MHYPPPIFAQASLDAATSFGSGGIALPSSGAPGLSQAITLPASLALPGAAPQPLENGGNATVQPASPSSVASPSMPLPTLTPDFVPPARHSRSSAPAGSLPPPNTLLTSTLIKAGPFVPIAPSGDDATVDKPKTKKRAPPNKKAVIKASTSLPAVQGPSITTASNSRKRPHDAVEEDSNKKRTKFEEANPGVARGMVVFKPSIPPQANVGADSSTQWSHPPSVPGPSFIPPPPPATTRANYTHHLVHRQLAAGQMPVVHDASQGIYAPRHQPGMQMQHPEAQYAPHDGPQPAAFQQSMQYPQAIQMQQPGAPFDVSRLLLCQVPKPGVVPPDAQSIVSRGGNVSLANMVVGPRNEPFSPRPDAQLIVRLLRRDKLASLRQSEGESFYGNELYDMQTLESVVLRIDFFPGKPTMPQGQGFPAPAHYVPAYPQTPHTSGDDVPLPFVNDTLNHPSPHQYAYAPAAPYVEAAQVNPFASYQYAEESTCAPGDDIPNLEAYPQTDFSVSWDPLLAYDASTQTGQSHCILTSEEYNSEVYHHFTPPAQVAYDAQMPTGQPQFVPPFEEYPYSQTDSESMASSTMYLSQEELDASTPSSTVSPITPQPETFIARS